MMTYGDWLSALQMSVTGDGRIRMLAGLGKESPHDFLEGFTHFNAGILEKQAHVGGNLIVATASCVQLGGGWSLREKSLFKIHVNVLEFGVPLEGTLFDFMQEFVKACMNGIALLLREETHLGQHGGVGLASSHVEGGEAPVERHGLAKPLHQLGRAFAETTAPSHLFVISHGETDFSNRPLIRNLIQNKSEERERRPSGKMSLNFPSRPEPFSCLNPLSCEATRGAGRSSDPPRVPSSG